MGLTRKSIWFVACAMLVLAASGVPAYADTLTGTFYLAPGSGNPDFTTSGGGINPLTTSLGPDGLPVLAGGSASAGYNDYNSKNELEWWNTGAGTCGNAGSPCSANLSLLGTSTVTLGAGCTLNSVAYNSCFINTGMYQNVNPPYDNGPNDANGYLTAEFTGQFTTSGGSTSFGVCSDDDEFVYINGPGEGGANGTGTLVVANGGVHGTSCASPTSLTLGAGTYTLDIFYADQQQTGAVFELGESLALSAPPPTGTPEPGTLSMLGLGILGLARLAKKRLLS